MPSILVYKGYKIYFWSDENGEPIHVHVSKGSPRSNATKIWITQYGNTIVSNNNSKISKKDLILIECYIQANIQLIIMKWVQIFGNVTYYC